MTSQEPSLPPPLPTGHARAALVRPMERRRAGVRAFPFPFLVACALAALALVTAPDAPAQLFGGGAPGQAKPAEPAPPKDMPETHAASGGESFLPPSSEPSLPADPLKLPKGPEVELGADVEPDDVQPPDANAERGYYGLYYQETSPNYSLRAVLPYPFWIERLKPSLKDPTVRDRASLYGGFYYQRRAAGISHDVLFPIFWNLNNDGDRTTIVGPLVNRSAPGETDNWLAPLYFTGTRKDGSYALIPPLLTYTHSDASGGFNLIALMYCSWSGGPGCDTRTAHDLDLGVVPFYFFGQSYRHRYELIPPLLHYASYDDADESWANLWGPYYREHKAERDYLHVMPLYWSIWGPKERHTTVLPFFHYGHHGDNDHLLATPLFVDKKAEDGAHTFVTWGYARHRGRTELDMFTPLFWHYRDPSVGLDEKLLFPLAFTRRSPRESTTTVFPLFSHSERYGLSKSLWITPLFNHTTDTEGWSTNVYPLAFFGRKNSDSHSVVAPLYWDFVSRDSRSTVVFPLFWRFSSPNELNQLTLNTFYHETRGAAGTNWSVHVFPLVAFGGTPTGHWWDVLYGLAGYERDGARVTAKTLWIPFELGEATATPAEPTE